MAKRMLADVLWEAANVHLSHNVYTEGKQFYSCNAALKAEMGQRRFNRAAFYGPFRSLPGQRFLVSLGCFTSGEGAPSPLDSFRGDELQGVRYMWLLLAMHVAEDEGIEVDA